MGVIKGAGQNRGSRDEFAQNLMCYSSGLLWAANILERLCHKRMTTSLNVFRAKAVVQAVASVLMFLTPMLALPDISAMVIITVLVTMEVGLQFLLNFFDNCLDDFLGASCSSQ